MGGEGVQVSNTSKSFQQQQQQQQHLKQQQQISMSSNGMASSSSTSSSSSSGGGNGGGGLAYATNMHYNNASNSNNSNALSPSSTASSGSGDDTQQRGTSRNSMSSNSGGMDTQQQQQQQQHALYQNQIMNAASAMNSGAMSQVTCLVCYNAQVDMMLEPCHHQFHAHCIDRWLNKDKVCPICWNPIQSQRRILAPAGPGLYNQQQQQQQQQQLASQPSGGAPGGPPQSASQNLPRGGYAPNPSSNVANNSGSVGLMAPSSGPVAAAGAPTDVPGGLAGVATMTNEPPNPATMRKGKWTAEESLYCDRLIEEFKKGNLPLAEGTTLRTFLSKLLNCDPMRISKKYTGDQCIGKIIFRRREDEVSKDDMELIRRDLAELEKTYLEREQYNQRRREKRLESELSRDKSRYIAARTLGYNSNSGSTPTAAANAARPQMPVPVAPVGHYQQQNVVSAPMSAKDMNMPQVSPHHAQFPPTRGPMPIQHPSNPNIHPPRYPQHHLQHLQQQHHQQQQQHQQHQQQQQQQQPMQSSSSHLFNSSLQSSSSMSSATNAAGPHPSSAESGSLHSGSNDSGGRSSGDGSFLSANHSGANNSSGNNNNAQVSSSQHQQQQQHQEHQQQSSSESFPRVSSIDSFSCLFPRVASIDNFQLPHQGQGNHNNNNHHQSGGYGNNSGSFGESLSNSYDHSSGSMVKSMSIGDGLNAYFPRIQSLEQLSSLLQEHAPPSPRSKDENENGNKQSKSMKEEGSSSSLTSGSIGGLADRKRMYDSHNSSSSNHVKEEQQREVDADLHRRLSPNGPNKPTEHSNQIQIPKPLSKMPRSSSGIFPRIPSMDKLPRVPSLDKLPRIPSMDKLASSMDKIPRIPSMDKLPRVPSMDKLSSMPRIPSHSDMLSRFGSSDHLSSFPSFSNLSSLSTCASYNNLSGLNGGGSGFKSGFPRNSSIEDILSLVASSENSGMSSAGSHLQLSALAAVAGEESSQMAAADRKRRLEHAQEMENKKNKVST